ncbi:MAG TPA: hypothetical protein VN673_07240 [Clostridia bacterium]|nr:hypothetical protein [Clostridia bacterium]
MNLETGEKASVRKISRFRDVIIGQNTESRSLRIFTRTENDEFVIRNVRFDGSLEKVTSIPCFAALHLETYTCNMLGLAVSEDASRIAYYDEATKDLRLYNLKDHSQDVLLTNAIPSFRSIRLLEWSSTNHLVVCIYDQSMASARCLMLEVGNKSPVFDFHPLNCVYAVLSPDGRYLAYGVNLREKQPQQYRIYDTQLRCDIRTLPMSDRLVSGPFLWTGRSDGLFYTERNRLMLYSLALDQAVCLREYTLGLRVHPKASSRSKVFYTVKPYGKSRPTRGLFAYDIDQQKELRVEQIKNNAELFASPDGKFLITGWGL